MERQFKLMDATDCTKYIFRDSFLSAFPQRQDKLNESVYVVKAKGFLSGTVCDHKQNLITLLFKLSGTIRLI
jgi:hypothetical protein